MVSVCLATYNGGKYIKEQLDSILVQLLPEDEVVIADDSSTDATVAVIESFTDARIRLFKGNTFRDPIKNFQYCLTEARGDLIFLSDQDDVWIGNKYARMKSLLEDFDLVVSDSVVVDEKLDILEPSFFEFFGSGKGILKNIWRSSYYGSCMAFRSSLLERALPFPDTKEIGHDLWLGLVAELCGKVLFLDEQLMLYRRHGAAFTTTGLPSTVVRRSSATGKGPSTPVVMSKSKRTIREKIVGRLIMIREVLRFLKRCKFKRP